MLCEWWFGICGAVGVVWLWQGICGGFSVFSEWWCGCCVVALVYVVVSVCSEWRCGCSMSGGVAAVAAWVCVV